MNDEPRCAAHLHVAHRDAVAQPGAASNHLVKCEDQLEGVLANVGLVHLSRAQAVSQAVSQKCAPSGFKVRAADHSGAGH